jgi:hypothetical protein
MSCFATKNPSEHQRQRKKFSITDPKKMKTFLKMKRMFEKTLFSSQKFFRDQTVHHSTRNAALRFKNSGATAFCQTGISSNDCLTKPQNHKTFSSRNLPMFVISCSVCTWQAFPA